MANYSKPLNVSYQTFQADERWAKIEIVGQTSEICRGSGWEHKCHCWRDPPTLSPTMRAKRGNLKK